MDILKLRDILVELRDASKQLSIKPSEADLKAMMKKYDMLFLGANFNHIYSLELAHSIRTIFGMAIDSNELNKLIPSVCEILGMKYESMVLVSDAAKPNPPTHCYQIKLW